MVRGGLMVLNKNGMPESVIGTKFSYSALKSMTKDELIELLYFAQHNYECVNERLTNLSQYEEKLDKAFDKACEILESYDRFVNCYAFCKKEDWEEALMKGDEE